ncbi:MAG: DUF362 domain-containing protein [Clostridiales bacterium]|nr:DUF362 domain-containing protein [Clostridiales bacterium]
MSSIVSIKHLDDYNNSEMEKAVFSAFENFSLKLKPRSTVLIKPALPENANPDLARTTHPSVVQTIVNYFSSLGHKCIVADSPYKKYSQTSLEELYLNTGMLGVANNTTCELNNDLSTTTIEFQKGVKAKSFTLLDVVNRVDAIINVGKLKMDNKIGYVGATQNLFGLVPGELKTQILNQMEEIEDFNHYLIDLYELLKDKLTLNVLDAVVTLEAEKTQRMLSFVGVSDCPFALDACACEILGLNMRDTIVGTAIKRGVVDETPYKLKDAKIEDFSLEDYNLYEFNNKTKITKSTRKFNRFLNHGTKKVVIDASKCKGCGVCSKICPSKAIMMKLDKNGELYACVDQSKCIHCFKCYTACPYSVVEVKESHKYKKIQKEIHKYDDEN